MTIAWLITALAIAGVIVGVLGHARVPSSQLTAAGGGLLSGICIFWLMPEISSAFGLFRTAALVLAICVVLLLADRWLGHAEHASPHILLPLLAATSLHSFFDGWSIRMLEGQVLANVAVPIGLALHKFPEGLALGWLARKAFPRFATAIGVACGVELLTVVGAFVEPLADHSGVAAFGTMWTGLVLAAIGGSFLFLGLHAILPDRKRPGIVAIFLSTFAVIGLLSFLREPV